MSDSASAAGCDGRRVPRVAVQSGRVSDTSDVTGRRQGLARSTHAVVRICHRTLFGRRQLKDVHRAVPPFVPLLFRGSKSPSGLASTRGRPVPVDAASRTEITAVCTPVPACALAPAKRTIAIALARAIRAEMAQLPEGVRSLWAGLKKDLGARPPALQKPVGKNRIPGTSGLLLHEASDIPPPFRPPRQPAQWKAAGKYLSVHPQGPA